MHRFRRDFVSVLKELAPKNAPLVIGISGGADSVALTLLLTKETLNPLVLAHFNHGLRGEESDLDEAFVSELANNLETLHPGRIRYVSGSPTTPLKMEKGNLEANARKARYSWLVQMSRELGCESILTGHHAQDQAETVLFHILRGTGPLGLKGIAPKKKLGHGINLIRPLLEFSPELLRRYLNQICQSFREDSSNRLGQFTRNRIRQEILPLLTKIMGKEITPSLAVLAWHARYLHKKEKAKIRNWISRHAKFSGPGRVSLPVIELIQVGKYSAMGIIGQIAKILDWPRQELSRNHYKAIWNQIQNQVQSISLPQGIKSSLDAFRKNLIVTHNPLELPRD